MESYLAVLGRPPESGRISALIDHAQRRGLIQLSSSPTLTVLAAPDLRRTEMPDSAGIILGDLYSRDGPRAGRVALGGDVAATIRAVRGDWLLDRCWGRYVALLVDARGAPMVLRDPSGGIGCWTCVVEDAAVVASDLSLLADQGLVGGIDWRQAGHFLAYEHLRTRRTGILNVSELLAGERGVLEGGKLEIALAWKPDRFVDPGPKPLTFSAASDQLAREVRRCTAGLATPYDSISLALSGGLDSSIVASAVPRDKLHALNCVTPGPEGDERGYAQLVAKTLGVELEEHHIGIEDYDLMTPPARHLARPGRFGGFQQVDEAFHDHAVRHRAQAFFNGAGGDNVFCFLRSGAPIVDRWRSGDLAGAAVSTCDIARLNGWTLTQTFKDALSRRALSSRRPEGRFLRPDAVPPAPDPHPWLAGAQVRPGKRAHIASLVSIQGFLDGHARTRLAPVVQPLLAQPVMELCLGIPSWLWFTGGRDRAVARQAFTEILPEQVVNRRSKGGVDRLAAKVFENNRLKVRDALMDGLLVQHGVLDRQAIEGVMAHPLGPHDNSYARLIKIIDVEAWARSWT